MYLFSFKTDACNIYKYLLCSLELDLFVILRFKPDLSSILLGSPITAVDLRVLMRAKQYNLLKFGFKFYMMTDICKRNFRSLLSTRLLIENQENANEINYLSFMCVYLKHGYKLHYFL